MAPQKPVSSKLRGAPVDPQAEVLKAVGEMAERLVEALEAIADQMDLISLVVKRYGEKNELITAKDFEEEEASPKIREEVPNDGGDQA